MVQVVDRDLDLLRWINGFGFVTSVQVSRWMGVHEKVAVRRLRKLEQVGLVERERVFVRGGSIVTVSKEGIALAGDELGPMKKLRLGSFEHDRSLVDLSLDLVAKNAGSRFIPERRIRHERGLKGVGQEGHISDGFLMLSNGDRIAVELELTRKQRWRLKKIIDGFRRDLRIKSVWYFCAADVVDLVKEVVGDDDLFDVSVWSGEV